MDKAFKRQIFAHMYGVQELQKLSAYNEYDVNVAFDPGNPNGVVYYMTEEQEMDYVHIEGSLFASADQALREELRARREKALLEQKLVLVEQYGEDVYENDTVIKFSKRFEADKQMDRSARVYNYAVLKTNNQWYSTGRLLGFTRGSWDDLVLALVGGDFPVDPEDVIVLQQDTVTEESLRDRASVPEAPPFS
jgi:hypothetical protein